MELYRKLLDFFGSRQEKESQRIYLQSRIVFRKRYSKSVLILILLLVSSLIFASSLTSNSKIHIEGFKSQKIEKDHLIKIDSLWADISPTLKTQRLYGVQIEVETPFEILKMKSEQALFKEDEVILLKSVAIDSFLKNKSNLNECFKIKSESDAIIFNFIKNTLSGADVTIEFGSNRQKGRGFNLDLNFRKLSWLNNLIDLKSKHPIKTPLVYKLECKYILFTK